KNMIDRAQIQGVVLGCTELPLILTKDEFGIPFLNTTKIHAESAVRYCLKD
ncbi:aspartate/glutamate racemase family protein, partial [candidate division WOR-3 bacterium]|nr:aspartate/glutamate racemase family protein [candidate division WOR-3 bacterium]